MVGDSGHVRCGIVGGYVANRPLPIAQRPVDVVRAAGGHQLVGQDLIDRRAPEVAVGAHEAVRDSGSVRLREGADEQCRRRPESYGCQDSGPFLSAALLKWPTVCCGALASWHKRYRHEHFFCPSCCNLISDDVLAAGELAKCPHCGDEFVVPKGAPSSPVPRESHARAVAKQNHRAFVSVCVRASILIAAFVRRALIMSLPGVFECGFLSPAATGTEESTAIRPPGHTAN